MDPDEFYVFKNPQKNTGAVVRRVLGSKKIRMVFSSDVALMEMEVETKEDPDEARKKREKSEKTKQHKGVPHGTVGKPHSMKFSLLSDEEAAQHVDTSSDEVTTLQNDPAMSQRFCLTEAQVLELGRIGMAIERHYRRPMDVEWALDG